MSASDLENAIEVIRDKLYYVPVRYAPRQTHDSHFFTTDNTLVYWNFFLDFGPLNLGQLYRFCQQLRVKLEDEELGRKRIFYYSGTHSHRRANSVFLIAAFSMLYLGRTPEEAFEPFRRMRFAPFHDASPCVCTYHLTILDCLRGLFKARAAKFFDFDTFDVEEYEHFEKVEEGDLNWIVDGRFLAFAGPHDTRVNSLEGYHTLIPEDYIPYFNQKNVGIVIRLNKKYYDENRFKRAGIKHVDMYYLDGSVPPEHLLQRFLQICESEEDAIAVHCKAGLGRTGTCIGCYIMKHYGFTAAEVIGWIRICRPGSIIGPQQHYLRDMQERMWREGEAYRQQRAKESPRMRGMYPSSDSDTHMRSSSGNGEATSHSRYGDQAQGDALLSRKSPKEKRKSPYRFK